LTAGFDTGFYIKSPDSKFRMRFGMESRIQGSVFQRKTPDPERIDPPSKLTIRPRSMQFMVFGNVFERFGFDFSFGLTPNPDRPLDSGTIYVANTSIVFSRALTIFVGLMMVPFGIEGSSYFSGFNTIERSMTFQNLAPIRDTGVAAMGELGNGRLFYSAAIIGGSDVANIDPEDEPDIVLRAQVQPIMGKLKIGASAQVGKQPFEVFGSGAILTNTFAQRDLLFYTPTNGLRQKYAADLLLTVGPWSLRGEGLYMKQRRDNLLNDAGQQIEDGEFDASPIEVMGGYGETSFFVVGAPRKPGLELVAKYERLAVQTKGPPNEIRPIELDTYTVGLNWYLRSSIRLQANVIRMDLERSPTPEFPSSTPDTYLDNATRYVGLMQLQFWFF